MGAHVNENEKKKPLKTKNSKNSNIQNSTFVRTTEKKIRKSLKGFKSDLRDEQRIKVWAPIGLHVNENEKKIKNSKFQKSKTVIL